MPIEFNVDDPAIDGHAELVPSQMSTAIIGTNTIPMPRQVWTAEQQAAWEARQPNLSVREATRQANEEAWMRNLVEDQRRIADSERALSMALRFQGLRGYENAIKSGVPSHVALAQFGPKMFYSRPQSLAPAMRLAKPVTPFVPQVKEIAPGVSAAQLGPQHWQVIEKPAPERKAGSLSDVEKATFRRLEKREAELEKEMSGSSWIAQQGVPEYAAAQKRKQDELAYIKQQLDAFGGGKPVVTKPAIALAILPLPKSKSELVKDSIYQTSKGKARWNGKAFERVD